MTDSDIHPASTTVVVTDQDGNKHWAARGSTFVKDGLADGSLTEVNDAPVSTSGQDLDTGSSDDGSGVGEPDAGDIGDGVDESVAGATTGGGARKRS